MSALHHCVDDVAVIRDGHKPFSRTIGDALSQLACRSIEDAYLRDTLEDMRFDRPARNTSTGGKCDNCGHDALLAPLKVYDGTDMATFMVCRSCR